METLTELLREAGHEFASVAFVVELVQGALLIGILAIALPRIMRPRLEARQARIVADLESARTADDERARCEREARSIVSKARKEAKLSLQAGRDEAEAERAGAMATADEEAAEIVDRARQIVESEKAAAASEASDRMVELVTVLARRYIDEGLTDSERAALSEKLVLRSLEGIDRLATQ